MTFLNDLKQREIVMYRIDYLVFFFIQMIGAARDPKPSSYIDPIVLSVRFLINKIQKSYVHSTR
jgi:hypothetical protein